MPVNTHKSKGDLNDDAWEKFLNWLDPDRDKAGDKYEEIRRRLIRIFARRGCCDGEHLADRTIDVVTSQIDWLIENFKGNPALYFYGVAKKIFLEDNKKNPPLPQPAPPPDVTEVELMSSYLDECLEELPERERRLVIRYHEKEKQEKIVLRRQLAEEWGSTINALRIKVHYIHTRLRRCIKKRLKGLSDR